METPQPALCGDTIEVNGEIHMCGRERGHSRGKKVPVHVCGKPCNCGRVWLGSFKPQPVPGDELKKSHRV